MHFALRTLAAAVLLATTSACEDGAMGAEEWGGMAITGRFAVGASGITSISAGDLTRDGSPDLLLVTRAPVPTVSILPFVGIAQTLSVRYLLTHTIDSSCP